MQRLEKRLSALEAARPVLGELTIIRRIIRPGELDAKVCAIGEASGKVWTRQAGEGEEDLLARVEREATRTAAGVARLVAHTENSHASN